MAEATRWAHQPLPTGGSNDTQVRVKLEMCIPCDVKAIESVIDRVSDFLETGREPKNGFEVGLALREALANAIVHGCREDKEKTVWLSVSCDESGGTTLIVRDPGGGFDHDSVPSPLRGHNLLACHGRGIFLIRRLMDEVRFARGGAEIRMRKISNPSP